MKWGRENAQKSFFLIFISFFGISRNILLSAQYEFFAFFNRLSICFDHPSFVPISTPKHLKLDTYSISTF